MSQRLCMCTTILSRGRDMGPKTRTEPVCEVCQAVTSKYRCPNCPARYCSVTCFKEHKATKCVVATSDGSSSRPFGHERHEASNVVGSTSTETQGRSRKRLTEIQWPPEPDPDIFTDPLRREDPKPLRQEELMRIATSPHLRHLLVSTALPRILRIVDAIPSPFARSSALTRLLGVDDVSLSKPGAGKLLSQRESPPPLQDLLSALAGQAPEAAVDETEAGWWLGQDGTKEGRIWIGPEEKELVRVWAGIVCQAIDGSDGDPEWGSGGLAWEV